MSQQDRPVHQPIHPDVRPLLDPEYVAFHDEYFQYLLPDDQKIWDGSARVPSKSLPRTESVPVDVANVRDISLENFKLRVFTPSAGRPAQGWPVFLWFHGGGWAVGDITSGNDLCALICKRAECVVVTVGYRLAPEHPFPAAFDDSVEALKWVVGREGALELGINPSQVGVGGTSAGGQLAASLSIKAAILEPPIPIKFQLLVVPVIDNTATEATVWAPNQNAPWLTPARMLWYRQMYLPNKESQEQWEASPCKASPSLLATSPNTWIAVSEQDLLAPEGTAYAHQLRDAWESEAVEKQVFVKSYKGSTHSILAMSGKDFFFFSHTHAPTTGSLLICAKVYCKKEKSSWRIQQTKRQIGSQHSHSLRNKGYMKGIKN